MDDKLDGSEPIELLNMNHDEKADELGELSRGSDCRFFCTLHTVGLHITHVINNLRPVARLLVVRTAEDSGDESLPVHGLEVKHWYHGI